jgi:hypothetical protein
MEGYTFQDIAKKLRMSSGTITRHIRSGILVLPERDWTLPKQAGVPARSAVKWAEKGVVQRSYSGLYRKSQLIKHYNSLMTRECAHYECTKPVLDLHSARQFCDEHSYFRIEGSSTLNPERGISIEHVLQVISENPGINRSSLQNQLRAKSDSLFSVLLDLEQKKYIVSYRGYKGGIHFRPTSNEEKAM